MRHLKSVQVESGGVRPIQQNMYFNKGDWDRKDRSLFFQLSDRKWHRTEVQHKDEKMYFRSVSIECG